MQLKHIKLSGFKSFVDSTKVAVPNNLVGIVGPNGCGKSNVLDAIRWVMGESSAKTLRGESMEDVIFNGSAVRKPVNRAYVELVFDNRDGTAPGSYAKFAEIAVRRELVREGGSKYFINKTRCRRKDIQDIFLGTGLGPRSYSIIEQGMVGRIVESKPEDLRVLIEEAAGISKYKDRRRETENRIRHTRDNLNRVEDIVGELETQLRRLKRQANDAERYKQLKQEQRDLELQGKTLQWAEHHQQVQSKELELERIETEFAAQLADQRGVESQIENMRQEQVALTEVLNQVQAKYYGIGGEIAALEQSIEHARVTRQQLQEEFDRLTEAEREAAQHLDVDQTRFAETQLLKAQITPLVESLVHNYETVYQGFQRAESDHQNWQKEWEQLNQAATEPDKQREVQHARIEEQERKIHHFSQRSEQISSALLDIEQKINIDEMTQLKQSVDDIEQQCVGLEANLQQHEQNVTQLRSQLEDKRERYNLVRHQWQDDSAQLNSLKALQAAAVGAENQQVNQWLQLRGIKDNARIASQLQVQAGWELAVDTVLSKHLNAISVAQLETFANDMVEFKQARISVVDEHVATVTNATHGLTLLADKVSSPTVQIAGWLHGVYAMDNVTDALANRQQLRAHESIVTRDGCWLGSNWVSFGVDQGAESGVLQREAKIEKLTASIAQDDQELQKISAATESLQVQIKQLEGEREQSRSEFRDLSQKRTQLHNKLGGIEARSSELIAQRDSLLIEKQQLNDQTISAKDEVNAAQNLMEAAKQQASNFDQQRAQLAQQRDALVDGLENARQAERSARDQRQEKQIELERLQSNYLSLQESIARLSAQLEGQSARRTELITLLQSDDDPVLELREKLQTLLEKRLGVEQELSTARNNSAEFDNQMQSADQQRLFFDRQAQAVRDSLEQVKMSRQELRVRRDTIAEQLAKNTEQMTLLWQALPEGIEASEVQDALARISSKVERIGAVNLVAIDEYEECSQRKVYLDKQLADLNEAMATLEAAITKIDKETRARFKETFDLLNERFQIFFPKLFGGGSAYLELTGNDLLDTGVGVMARPPGKRNSTIALLSGGEKALTAVSLLFAFFELNPAPFCVLDEVDAPMDDANAERYAQVLKQLGEKTQLLFITHNKITMEVADILVGVTMAEPGVSRLVAVDVAQASAMATT